MEQLSESAVVELSDNSDCDCDCNCEGECRCNHEKSEIPEIFDDSDIERIIANLNDWDLNGIETDNHTRLDGGAETSPSD